MIPFDKYLDKYAVLATNYFNNFEDLYGIRIHDSQVFKFKGKYVIARPLTKEDLKDEDFLHWLDSVWKHDETNLKLFLKHKRVK